MMNCPKAIDRRDCLNPTSAESITSREDLVASWHWVSASRHRILLVIDVAPRAAGLRLGVAPAPARGFQTHGSQGRTVRTDRLQNDRSVSIDHHALRPRCAILIGIAEHQGLLSTPDRVAD